jgi:RHS repeat-associated protein
VLLGDVDGDGLDDLVYVQPDRITLWINQGGNRWSDPITLDAPPPVLADVDAVRLADMLGVGTAGVLWTVDQVSPADETYQFLDLTGGTKPYLLERIDNHRGAVTQVGYAPSTRFYLDDQADPATRWTTPLPFPVQVVEQVEAIDLLSGGKLTSQYRYHHGYWDGAEREFRGFGMVEQLDSETFQRYHQPGLHGQQTPFTPVEQVHFSPPTLTKTWFHLGPVGEESGERHEADFSGEYWPDDPPTLGPTAIPEGLAASAQADALRALRGSVLRTELYGLDGSPLQARPYSITESQFGLREEAPPAPGQAHRRRIFFPHQLASRTTQWERGEEPLARFAFTDDYDQFGQPRTHIQIACPRDWQDAASRSNAYLASATQHTYATRDDDRYLVDRPATVTVFEIIQGDDQPRRTVAELRQAIGDGTAARGVIDQAVHHYDGEPFSGLPAGQIGEFGALVRSERLVLTEELLREAYASPGLGAPVYLAPDRPPDWTDEYPLAFRDRFPPLAGYTFLPGDPAHEPGYFAQTTRRRYDLHNGRGRPRGLVETTRDPLGRDTTIAYDRFGLFAGEVVDPVGLATGAVHDYRAFRPSLVTDANGNRSAFAFSPLGLLERSAVMGRQDEHLGDTLEVPGTRLVYDFLAFADSPADQRQPISVRTIRRVHHATNVEVPPSERDETLEMVEFSDGYGRLIQTRTQAEDMRFGDPVSGGSVLPAAQDDPATGQPVIGQRNNDPQQPNVVVSGWQVHDNKGRVVERYEPFFATGWQFSVPTGPQLRQRVRSFYDPRGRVLRSVNPDGSQQRAVYGIPIELADPERFSPTPWEAFTYDPNDNAGRTHEDDARPYQDHWDTPSTVVIDALDRVVLRVERTRQPRAAPSDPPAPILELQTHHAYDIRGKLVRVTDALGRLAARHVYDLADRVLRTESIDAGVRCSVLDAAGNQIEQRDSKGALVLHAVDLLNRPSRLWARDSDQAVVTLRERLEYGDGGDPGQPAQQRAANRADNLLGRLHQHYDEAGLVIFARHDFKGNVLEKVRQVISDDTLMTVFPSSDDPAPDWRLSPFRVDWEPPTGTSLRAHAALLLDPAVYETSAVYDALNRVTVIRYPRDVDGGRKELQATYSRAGAVDRLQLDDVVFVDRVVYNAAGRRTLIAFGDGVMTRYAYEPQTFRLQRLRSERYLKPPEDTVTYRPTGAPLQDLAYRYDLAANLLSIVDRTPGCGVRANPDATSITDPGLRALVAAGGALLRRFTYDPLYRLVAATGRECTDGGQIQPWAEGARCGFNSASHGTPNQDNAPDLTHAYRQRYDYDPVGNLVRLGHDADASASSRTFGLAAGTNRLQTLTVGATEFQYAHDANGNLVGETSSRHLDWDHADRLKAFRTQAGTSEPSVHVQYLYDGDGQRVKCLRRLQGGGFEATTSIDGLFEHRRWRLDSRSAGANDYLHVLDNQDRIAVARVGAPHPDDKGPTVQYHLSDHLGTSTVVLDDNNGFINREEYTPYGETTFGGYARKRYRFTGTERDEDSGLCYHGARYFAPWLGRWTSPDPAGLADGPNPYRYARDNPMSMRDPTGYQAAPPPQTPQPASPPDPASSAAGADVSLAELLAWPRSTYLITAEQSHEAETSQPLTATTPLIVETDPEACCAELMANVRANLDQQAQAEQQRREFEQLGPILGAGDFVLKLWGASAVIGAAGGLAAAGAGAALVAAAQSAVGALSGAAQTAGIWTAVTFPRLTAGGMALLTALSGEGGPTGPAGQSTGQAGGAAAGVVPDVFTYRLLRLPVVATATGRGITQAVRQRLVAFFYKYGGKGPVDIAHNFGQEFVFLRSGASALVGAEMRSINRAEGSAISAAASLWRALNEQLPESLRRFVRPVGGQ